LRRLNKVIPVLLFALMPGAIAQNDSYGVDSKPKIAPVTIGPVNVNFDHATLAPGLWHFTGSVTLTSEDYDLNAEDIKIIFDPESRKIPKKNGTAALSRAVAVGLPDKPVIAHLRRPLESQDYTIYSDQAVYVPDLTRPSGGKMEFTGHVKVITDSGFLAVPSVSTFGSATVLLGAGTEYPQVITGAGHITLTPAQ
jgi:hypothetical protein